MTSNERQLLRTKSFDEIWVYAWYQNNASNIKHTSEYTESKYKFDFCLLDVEYNYLFFECLFSI
mgnify:CR=1 FL=1